MPHPLLGVPECYGDPAENFSVTPAKLPRLVDVRNALIERGFLAGSRRKYGPPDNLATFSWDRFAWRQNGKLGKTTLALSTSPFGGYTCSDEVRSPGEGDGWKPERSVGSAFADKFKSVQGEVDWALGYVGAMGSESMRGAPEQLFGLTTDEYRELQALGAALNMRGFGLSTKFGSEPGLGQIFFTRPIGQAPPGVHFAEARVFLNSSGETKSLETVAEQRVFSGEAVPHQASSISSVVSKQTPSFQAALEFVDTMVERYGFLEPLDDDYMKRLLAST